MDLVNEVERYEMKCVALQEVRWNDSTTIKILKTTFSVVSVNKITN